MRFRLWSLLALLIAVPVHSFAATQVWSFVPALNGGKGTAPVITSAPNGDVYTAFNLRPASGASKCVASRLNADGTAVWTVQLNDPLAANFVPHAIASDGTHVVITGQAEGPPSAKVEMFTVNLNSFNGSVRWVHEENINFLPDLGQKIVINGDSAFLAGAVGHAFAAIRVRLDDGLEVWERTFGADATSVETAVDLAVTPQREVFVCATRQDDSASPQHMVLVKISGEGQLLQETVAETDGSVARAMVLQPNGAIDVVGEVVTLEGIRPIATFFNNLGQESGSRIYLDDFGSGTCRFTAATLAPNGGFFAALKLGSSDITVTQVDANSNPIFTDVPGTGTVFKLLSDNNLNFFAAMSVLLPGNVEIGRVVRRLETDSINFGVTNTIVRAQDASIDPLTSNWLVGISKEVSSSGAKSVEFRGINPKPVAKNDNSFNTFQGAVQPLTVGAPGVLANDTAGAGSTAVGVNLPANVTLNADGSFAVNLDPNFNGFFFFNYNQQRGASVSTGTVSIGVRPKLLRIDLAPEVRGGQQIVGQAVLAAANILDNAEVQISENSNFTIPVVPIAIVPPNQDRASFTLNTAVPRTDQTVIVSASLRGLVVTKSLIVKAPRIASIVAVTPTVIGPAVARLRVTLDGPAPSNGIAVNLSDDSAFIATQPALSIPANQSFAEYTSVTAATTTSKVATVTASLNGSTASATVTIVGFTFTISPNTKVGGQQGTGTLTITSVAGAAIVFDLTDNSTATAFNNPPTGTITQGVATGTFQILTAAVVNDVTSTITATGQGVARTAILTVLAPVLDTVTVSPATLRGGSPFTCTVRLTGISVAGGSVVNLSDNSANVTLPGTATIGGGSASKLVNGTTTAVTSSFMVVITASRNGVTKTTTLVVTP